MRWIPFFAIINLFILMQNASAGINPSKEVPSETNESNFHVSSYVNGSYNYLLRSPYFISNAFDRENDIAKNGFRLQQAYLSLSSMEEGWGGFISVIAGLDAYEVSSYGWNADIFNLDNIGLTYDEAYLQYRYKDNTTFLFGMMSALAGYESVNYTEDTNFSRSLLDANAEPGTHSGVRVSRSINDTVGVIVGIGNGWSTIHNIQKLNTLEAAVSLKKTDTFSMMLSGYMGPQYLTDAATSGPKGVRSLFVFSGSYQMSKPLSVAWSLDYGRQTKAELPNDEIGNAVWAGIAAYINYKLNEKWRVSVRGEIFNDSDGYRTEVRQNLKEITLTFGINPIKNLSFMLETRHDFSNVNAFAYKNASGGNNNQQSYAIEALYQLL